jgi:hypothetical protein
VVVANGRQGAEVLVACFAPHANGSDFGNVHVVVACLGMDIVVEADVMGGELGSVEVAIAWSAKDGVVANGSAADGVVVEI